MTNNLQIWMFKLFHSSNVKTSCAGLKYVEGKQRELRNPSPPPPWLLSIVIIPLPFTNFYYLNVKKKALP